MEKGNTKQEIIEAALDLFSVQGFEATSVSQLADAVGIRKASLYSYFENKQAILDALVQEVLKKGGKIWFADAEGMAQALPGDVLMTYGSAPLDKNKIADGSGCKASHAIIYMGDGQIIHASSPKAGIKSEKADYYVTGKHAGHSFFLRPQSLIDADAAQNSNGGTGPDETAGTIDGMNYVCK